jgi:hypothetical protein
VLDAPEDLENLGYCEVYRLLHEMAPQELVARDSIVAPETPALAKPKPVSLPAGIAVNLDRIILSAWVMSDDEWPPFLEEDLAESASNLGDINGLAKQLGMDVYAYVPIPFQDAIADQRNLRPGKKLMTDLLFKLAASQLDASQFQAHLSLRIESLELDARLDEAKARGAEEVEIPIAPPIIEISVRHKDTDEILHDTEIQMEGAMDLEEVAQGIIMGLHSAGVGMGDEHKS